MLCEGLGNLIMKSFLFKNVNFNLEIVLDV